MAQFSIYIVIAFAMFVAFFIGLNLGIHGVLSVSDFSPSHLSNVIMNDIKYLEGDFHKNEPAVPTVPAQNNPSALSFKPLPNNNNINNNNFNNNYNNNDNKLATSTVDSSKSAIKPIVASPLVEPTSKIALGSTKSTDSAPVSQKETASKPEATVPASTVSRSLLPAIKSKSEQRISLYNDVHKVMTSDSYQSVMKNELSTLRREAKSQSIATYCEKSKLPILLMACNRPELLRNTLKSLLAVRGVTKEDIVVSQDGNMKEVTDVVREFGIELVQNTQGLNLRGGYRQDGAERIARHYKFSLSAMFRQRPDAAAIIIVEDDLLFSPDFYEYFHAVGPSLDLDKSLFVISAWNDNGFKGKVEDPLAIKRTEFFPGLGWMLSRHLYESELEAIWPTQHWDHWLRSPEIHKGREILYPDVPRTFHNGIKGTFMDLNTHNRYFRDIDYNTDVNVDWKSLDRASKDEIIGGSLQITYEKGINDLISACHHATSVQDIDSSKGIVCVWISAHPEVNEDFAGISSHFGIWHEHKRGGHRGLHNFYWKDKYILLLNVHSSVRRSYADRKPKDVPVIEKYAFYG